MGFHVDFDSLDLLYSGLYGNACTWNESLTALNNNVKTLVASTNMSGIGADNLKLYFENVHGSIISILYTLISAHINNCLLYVHDYQSGIDNSLHAVIDEKELCEITSELEQIIHNANDIDSAINLSLSSVSDIIDVDCPGFNNILFYEEQIKYRSQLLRSDISYLEENHYRDDFLETSALITSLETFINELLANTRTYKTDFSLDSLKNNRSFLGLAQSYVEVNAQIYAKELSIAQAIDDENERINKLNTEIEERQKKASCEKWIVTGVCFVASAVILIGSGGTATPLVVGIVSGVSGAVIAGNNVAADEYVKNGWDTSEWDISKIGESALLAGISGFITGYFGAELTKAAGNLITSSKFGSTLLNSPSATVRMGSGAVIGGITEVSVGVGTRGVSTFTVNMIESRGNIEESAAAAKNSAFSLESILIDATLGSFNGAVTAKTQPVGKKIEIDDLKDVSNSKPYHSPNPKKWIDKGGEIYVDANGTWTYVSPDGVNVCYSDGYPDFVRAGVVKKKYEIEDGFDTRNHNADINKASKSTGMGGKGSGDTWHHSTDGKTLWLVDTEIHEEFRHVGGFALAKGGN